jgi:methionine sulfoxide reductase heme-binding subunit
MSDPSTHIFWITSRAAGTAALLLSSFGVCIGLMMGSRLVRRRGVDLRVTHEAVSLATLVAIGVHGLSLVGDSFMHPSLADISIPFVSSYKTAWTTAGIVAGWALVALGLSYYARRWIGVQRWRMLHRFTVAAWALGVIHSLGEGTDAGQTWFLVMTAIAVVPALALFLARMSGIGRGTARERVPAAANAGGPA